MRVINDAVADRIKNEFAAFDVINGNRRAGEPFAEFDYALASGVTMEAELDAHRTDDSGNYIHQLEIHIYALDDEFEGIDSEESMPTMGDADDEFYTALYEDLHDILGELFGEFQRGVVPSDFHYRKNTSKGHLFHALFEIGESDISAVSTVPASVTVTATNEFEFEIPTSVIEDGEDAVRTYLVEHWWNEVDRSEKAQLLGLTNSILAIGDERVEDEIEAVIDPTVS